MYNGLLDPNETMTCVSFRPICAAMKVQKIKDFSYRFYFNDIAWNLF
jgi:hypothetical protein